ncbi:MAG: DUF853 family protein [Gammaproteobacteria bacterium]|nr:DUF853 family protein [Gammaproteobacteria bacterium]
MGVGEALVSLLDEKARPSITQRVYVMPPAGQIGPITPEQRQALLSSSLVAGVYEQAIDRESAYEKLRGRATGSADAAEAARSGSDAGAVRAPAAQTETVLRVCLDLFADEASRRALEARVRAVNFVDALPLLLARISELGEDSSKSGAG